jgi:hypothetical protein
VGPWGPFAETCVHLRDIARPLGLATDAPREDWAALLDYLASPSVAPALVPAGRINGLAFAATDVSFRHGTGPLVTGTAEAVAMALCGRAAALADLSGPGTHVLRSRVTGSR